MTREEAIEYLKRADTTVGQTIKTRTAEALEMAIKALEQEPGKDEVILTNKEYRELVSSEYENGYAKGYMEALEQESCGNDINVSTTDAISRSELLKAIDTWDKFGYTETGCFVREPKGDYIPYIHYDDVIKCINGMPPVNPQQATCEEREKGECPFYAG